MSAIKKFRDIPQFPRAHYEVDVPWKYIESNLEVLGEGAGLDLDPEYQRPHVWTDEQRTAFIEYMLQGGDVSRTIVFNCPFWGSAHEGVIELVDGKQRLEAVRAFMRDEVRAFGKFYSEFEDSMSPTEHRLKFQVCSLSSREEVLRLYLNINAGGTPHSAEELAKVREMLQEIEG